MTAHLKKSASYLIALFLSLSLLSSPVYCEENETLPQVEAISLSLRETIGMALANNKDIQIQEQDVAFARANIVDAQSRFFPAFNIGYSFAYTDSVYTTTALPDRRKDTRIFNGFKSSNELSLSGSQMIYDGGASIANLKEARVQLKIKEESLRAMKLDIEFEAKRLFYGLLLAYDTLRINQYLVDQAQAHYENVREKFQQGTSSRFDVLQSRVQVSKLIPPLVQAQNSIQIISNDLKKLLYLDMNSVIKLKEGLSYSPVDVKLDSFLIEAYRSSPQMKLRLLGIDLNKWAIEYAKSGWYPNINATAGYTYTSNKIVDMINPRHDNWNIGISGTTSIFDGMSTQAKVNEAKARYAQAVLSKENIVEQIAVDIRRGCLDLAEANAIILSQKDSLAEAKDALNIAYIGYDNGVMINLDVIDAQVSVGQVEKNLAAGIYDYLIAKAFLDRTMGREYLSFYFINLEEKNGKKE